MVEVTPALHRVFEHPWDVLVLGMGHLACVRKILTGRPGVAKARALHGQINRHVVAAVGAGALTGGMCWEAR
ncbi:1-deoxy-D-xylulose-5-phosphate synthase-like protein [Lentzea atacamensis]|uniref:1-deoxy-D-xylulose-5-phosphate synthase-like protein n=1 Tax=Lentzea atacamensis TaxID=531938 RepID=A0ABX9EET0_9PSEU|nr:1-deoxy-D-xylulose-5-phosphate synthase-like protein [Lentzea atacamensis]